jgi:2-dehydro-3-deoxyphosphogluconate aldolase/(4S)-4-hydroxy-2-oxoglutarate aldolase
VRDQVIHAIEKEKLIVIVRGVERKQLLPLAEAMYNGGIRLLEVTYDATGRISDKETAENIKLLSAHFENKMLIGAGTVLTEHQTKLTCDAGGQFIISPDVNSAVIKKTKALGMVSIPGALTPTEAQTAHLAGADFVKLFPLDAMGSPYLKAIRAPLSHIRFLAVGGINLQNISEYQKAGACGFGIGSNIIDKKLLREEDFSALTTLAKAYVTALKSNEISL